MRRKESKEEGREIKDNIAEKYSKVSRPISRFSKWISAWMDRILFSQRYGKLVALLLAVFVYAIINIGDSASSLFETKQVYTFKAQTVNVLVNEETYEVSGLPETVDVQLLGDINDLQMVRQQNSLSVVADLRQLGEGRSDVELEVQNIPSRLEVIIEPGTVSVELKKKQTQTYALGYDFVNQSEMDATYDLGTPEFDEDTVTVRASEDTLNRVSYVKALIDVSGVTSDFETDAPLAAYDENGDRLEVDIIPSTMHVSISVTQPKKTVPIEVVQVGTMEEGLAISTCTLSDEEITLYAKQSVLDQIDHIEISLPVSNITSDRTLEMPITLPQGVTQASLSSVSVSVTVGERTSATFSDVQVRLINQEAEIDGMPITLDPRTVSVTVSGSEEMLQNITKEDIMVTADLKGITAAGERQLTLSVSGPNRLVEYQLETSEITVTVSG
ncbi:MAG: CdaR family protein [Merdibacter sp.]|nr:CdaR family protein [Merdibacter sp.]